MIVEKLIKISIIDECINVFFNKLLQNFLIPILVSNRLTQDFLDTHIKGIVKYASTNNCWDETDDNTVIHRYFKSKNITLSESEIHAFCLYIINYVGYEI